MDATGMTSTTFGVGVSTEASPTVVTQRQRAFASVIARASAAGAAEASGEGAREAKSREAAEQLVALTFVQPMLKQLRESSNAAAPFGASAAEKSIRQMADGTLAQQLVHASRWGVVDSVARRMRMDSQGRGESERMDEEWSARPPEWSR